MTNKPVLAACAASDSMLLSLWYIISIYYCNLLVMVYIILVGSQVTISYQFCGNYETLIVSVHKNSQYLVCSTRNESSLSSGKEVVLNPDPTVSFAHVTAIAQLQRIRSSHTGQVVVSSAGI